MAAALLFSMVFYVSFGLVWLHQPASGRLIGNVLQIIMFSDLECDYINPIDLCNKLNQVCTID
jgi:hypothetical protein